jgi:hypothetical protein
MWLNLKSLLPLLALLGWSISSAAEPGHEARGRQFIGLNAGDLSVKNDDPVRGETTFTSPKIEARFPFNEAVISWNIQNAGDSQWSIEASAQYPDGPTKYYTLGEWSAEPAKHPRKSVAGQNDDQAKVATDTLVLKLPAQVLRVRVRASGPGIGGARLKFIGISLADTSFKPLILAPERAAWDKTVAVPERTQMIYPNGGTLCSPTTVSMIMAFWAVELKRPELDEKVPAVVEGVFDSQWPGAGNWPFNMAYVGSFPGMKAYVSRLSDVSELEQWIAKGIPVGLSVDYDRLRAKGPGPNGHLVVCVGFTNTGDPIINDPGTSKHVRKIFPRANLVNAWASSKNTVYLVYPENAALPTDRFGHWDSAVSREFLRGQASK